MPEYKLMDDNFAVEIVVDGRTVTIAGASIELNIFVKDLGRELRVFYIRGQEHTETKARLKLDAFYAWEADAAMTIQITR